jgi:hypothetical protein
MAAMTLAALFPSNARLPVSISYSTNVLVQREMEGGRSP